jgi:hypothetical protein
MTDDEKIVPRVFIWIGVVLAFEQVVHALTLGLGSHRRLIFGLTTRPFRLPTGLALVWVIFTALSIVLTALTFRSNAAILSKTAHVVIEGLFLMFLLGAFGFRLLAGVVGFFLLVGIVTVLALPCSETVLYAGSSGLFLDAVNFLVYAWYGISQPNDYRLWLVIWAFGWHALYLISMVGVMRWDMISDASKLGWRISGLYANIVASELFLAAVRREMKLADGGIVDLKVWSTRFDSEDLERSPLCVWTRDSLRLLGPLPPEDAEREISLFQPGRTAFTRRALRKSMYAFFPFFTNRAMCTRHGTTTRLEFALLCGYGWFQNETVDKINQVSVSSVYVLSWGNVRGVYWLVCVVVALVAASYP